MQLTYTDYKNYLDAVLEWGMTHLLSPSENQALNELEKGCKRIIESEELDKFLLESMMEIERLVNLAISTLSNIKLIDATEDDDIWYDAQEAFKALDRFNYFKDAAKYLISSHSKKSYEKLLPDFNRIFSEITSWPEFSPLRLTVLNEIRIECLNSIPEDEKYRFPWYEDYSDYDECTLEIIIEHLDNFLNEDWSKLTDEIPEYRLDEISNELKRDKKLFSKIKQEYAMHKSLIEMVPASASIRLWRLANNTALEYTYSPQIEGVGIERVARKILEEALKKIRDNTDKVYWAFLTAFCGPGLNTEQRLNLLDRVECMIQEIDEGKFQGNEANVLKPLKQWYQGKHDDLQLARISFDTWKEKMEEQNIEELLGNQQIKLLGELHLWDVIGNLINKNVDKNTPLKLSDLGWCLQYIQARRSVASENLTEYASSLILGNAVQPSIQAFSLVASREPAVKKFELVGKKFVNISIKPNSVGKYCILTKPNTDPNTELVVSCDAMENYKELWNYLNLTTGNYWGGCGIKEDDTYEPLSTKQITEPSFYKTTGNRYKYAIIGISHEKKHIEVFIKNLCEQPITEPLDIIVLIVTLVR